MSEEPKVSVTTTITLKMGSRKVLLSRDEAYAVFQALSVEFDKAKNIGQPMLMTSLGEATGTKDTNTPDAREGVLLGDTGGKPKKK